MYVLAAVAVALVALARAPAASDPPAACVVVDVATPAPLVAQLAHAPVACICESCTLLSEPGTGRFAAAVRDGAGSAVLDPAPGRPEVRLLYPQKVLRREGR